MSAACCGRMTPVDRLPRQRAERSKKYSRSRRPRATVAASYARAPTHGIIPVNLERQRTPSFIMKPRFFAGVLPLTSLALLHCGGGETPPHPSSGGAGHTSNSSAGRASVAGANQGGTGGTPSGANGGTPNAGANHGGTGASTSGGAGGTQNGGSGGREAAGMGGTAG